MPTVKVLGLPELEGKLNDIANVDLKSVLEKCAIKVRDDAKQKVPNRHGELEKSLTYAFEDDYTVAIGTNKEYAPYVEIGTGIWAGVNTQGLYSQYAGTGRQTPWAWPATPEEVELYGIPMAQQDIGTGKNWYDDIDGGDNYYNVSYDKNGQAWIWTRGQWGQPYLLPALLENEPWIHQQIGELISKEVKK